MTTSTSTYGKSGMWWWDMTGPEKVASGLLGASLVVAVNASYDAATNINTTIATLESGNGTKDDATHLQNLLTSKWIMWIVLAIVMLVLGIVILVLGGKYMGDKHMWFLRIIGWAFIAFGIIGGIYIIYLNEFSNDPQSAAKLNLTFSWIFVLITIIFAAASNTKFMRNLFGTPE